METVSELLYKIVPVRLTSADLIPLIMVFFNYVIHISPARLAKVVLRHKLQTTTEINSYPGVLSLLQKKFALLKVP